MIDEKTAHLFQQRYLDGQRGAMAGLYAECRHITEALAKAYIARHDGDVSGIDDTIQLILSRVLSRYRNPEYKIHSFSKVLNIEIVHEFSNHRGPKAQLLKSVVSLDSVPEPRTEDQTQEIQTATRRFLDIYSATRILIRLAKERTYRGAILEIEKITGRRWIYDHGVQLHYVWRHLRRGKAERAGERRRGHPGRDRPADSRDQRPPPKGKQAEPEHDHR